MRISRKHKELLKQMDKMDALSRVLVETGVKLRLKDYAVGKKVRQKFGMIRDEEEREYLEELEDYVEYVEEKVKRRLL